MLEERDYSPREQKKLNPPINSLFLFGRRKFVTLICWAAPMIAGWPVAGRAQRLGTEKRIAILMSNAEADPEGEARIAAFRQSLEKLGWTDGRNLGPGSK